MTAFAATGGPTPERIWLTPVRAHVGLTLLFLLRALAAMLLPLSADEAYYWLWSKHLEAGYYDHPPAIAFLIRAGTSLFGDTPGGVRAAGVLLSLAATWFVWQSARSLLKNEARALLAALLFNLTLMMGVELLAATPDLPSIVTAAAFLFCLARLQETEDGRWWLAAGVAAGLGLLSKYSALFLGAGALLWLLANPRGRAWLKTPWPWIGGLLALLVFLPNLIWEAGHQWETFVFQFGRVGHGHLTARYLLEFLGAEFGLATPCIFILGVCGLLRARRGDDRFLLTALMLPAIAFFFIHALHERVQGNWPCFLFPAFAIMAADSWSAPASESPGWKRWVSIAAIPLAALMLLLVYLQALTGILPLGNRDPMARLLGVGFHAIADSVADAARGGAVLTTDYETTAWLRFYEPGLKVVQVGETWRYPSAPAAENFSGTLLYLVETRRDQSDTLRRYFSVVELASRLKISRKGTELSDYALMRLDGQKAPVPGKRP